MFDESNAIAGMWDEERVFVFCMEKFIPRLVSWSLFPA